MNDLTVTRIRRRLETMQLPVPRPEVLEEIVDFIERSDTYYSVKQHEDILDRAVTEALGPDADAAAFHEGYREALVDIELLSNTQGDGETDADNGPTAA